MNYRQYIESGLITDKSNPEVGEVSFLDSPSSDCIFHLPIGAADKLAINIVKNYTDINRVDLCIAQFSNYTNVDREGLSAIPFVKYYEKENIHKYLLNMRKSKYCLSPHGDMADCYRHWEAMYMGCIPITLKHKQLERFYELPILFLDSWDQLTEQLLIDSYDSIMSKSDPNKLNIEYWIDELKKFKGEI